MAKLYVALYHAAAEVAMGYHEASDILDVGVAADTSAPLGSSNKIYRARISADVACQYLIGPVQATIEAAVPTSPLFLSAGQLVFDWFQGGDRITVIEQQ